MNEKIDLFDLVTKIIILIVAIIVIYLLVTKIIGKSPEIDEIQNMILILLVSLIISLYYKFGKFESRINSLITSFAALAKDFKEHLSKK